MPRVLGGTWWIGNVITVLSAPHHFYLGPIDLAALDRAPLPESRISHRPSSLARPRGGASSTLTPHLSRSLFPPIPFHHPEGGLGALEYAYCGALGRCVSKMFAE